MDTVDRWGRTPVDIACLQGWDATAMQAAFGVAANENSTNAADAGDDTNAAGNGEGTDAAAVPAAGWCTKPLRRPTGYKPFQYTEAGGGYLTMHVDAALPSTCDFDIVDATNGPSLSPAEFQHTSVCPLFGFFR